LKNRSLDAIYLHLNFPKRGRLKTGVYGNKSLLSNIYNIYRKRLFLSAPFLKTLRANKTIEC